MKTCCSSGQMEVKFSDIIVIADDKPTNLSSKEIVLKAFVDFSLKFNHSSKMCKIFSSIISPTVNQHLALQLPCSHNCRLSASLWLVNKAGSFMQCVFCLFFLVVVVGVSLVSLVSANKVA